MSGNFLLIYIWNFHVLNNLLLIYICKLYWNPTVKELLIELQTSKFSSNLTFPELVKLCVQALTTRAVEISYPWKFADKVKISLSNFFSFSSYNIKMIIEKIHTLNFFFWMYYFSPLINFVYVCICMCVCDSNSNLTEPFRLSLQVDTFLTKFLRTDVNGIEWFHM